MNKFVTRIIQRYSRFLKSKEASRGTPLQALSAPSLRYLPKSHQEAARTLKDWPAVKSIEHKKRVDHVSRENVHPDIALFYTKLIKELDQRGFPFHAFQFWRTHAEQERRFNAGVSNARGGESPHQYGCAVDVIHDTSLWDRTEKEWALVGTIASEVARKIGIKIVWGGDWDSDGDMYDNRLFDAAHFELKHWRELRVTLQALADTEGCSIYALEDQFESPAHMWFAAEKLADPKRARGFVKRHGLEFETWLF